MIKNRTRKKNKPYICVLVILFTLFFASNFTFVKAQEKPDFLIETNNFLKIISDSFLKVYQYQGEIVYDKVGDLYIILNNLGNGALATYKLGGIIFHEGLKNTTNTYLGYTHMISNIVNKDQIDIDTKLINYTSNVSGGVNLVKDFVKENINQDLSGFDDFTLIMKKITAENVDAIFNGFEYLTDTVLKVPVSGLDKLGSSVSSVSNKFTENIKSNLGLINKSLVSSSQNIVDSTKQTFEIKLMDGKNFNVINQASVISSGNEIIGETLSDTRCFIMGLLGTQCGKDVEKEKAQLALSLKNSLVEKIRDKLEEQGRDNSDPEVRIIENRIIQTIEIES